MTVREWMEYFANRDFFPDPEQDVDMVFAPDDVSMEKGIKLEPRGTVVPNVGEEGAAALVAFHPSPKRKYKFLVRFDADYTVEEDSPAKALEKLHDKLRGLQVMRFAGCCGDETSWILEDGFSRIEIFKGREEEEDK